MKNNFLQVGQTKECSNCHPEKGFLDCGLIFKEHGIKCNCICHDKLPGVSQWREMGKKYGYWDFFVEQETKKEPVVDDPRLRGLFED